MGELIVPPGAEGIVRVAELPDDAWTERFDRIVVAPGCKERLLNHLLLSLELRARIDRVRLPLHGLVVLAGPPGTGKTTLACGLADRVARALGGDPLLFVEIDAHAFPSQLLGESQRNVGRLFGRTLPDLARRGQPMVVLLDEVEGLAVARTHASLETNPVDVHRATEALLAGVDQVAEACPNVTFVATTNHRLGVDRAFLSRADLVEWMGLPDADTIRSILDDTLRAIGAAGAADDPTVASVAAGCAAAQLDARQVRKLVIRALASDRALVEHPAGLRAADLQAALADGSDGARSRGANGDPGTPGST